MWLNFYFLTQCCLYVLDLVVDFPLHVGGFQLFIFLFGWVE